MTGLPLLTILVFLPLAGCLLLLPVRSRPSLSRPLVLGVALAAFSTTGQPAARAGATFLAASMSGKFHGTTCPQTPIGRALRPGSA